VISKTDRNDFNGKDWRLGWLMDTADLSSIGHRQFALICRLLKGATFSTIVDGRQFLIDTLAKAVAEHTEFRQTIADKQFCHLAYESTEYFFQNLECERALLDEVAEAVVKLDATAGMALMMHVESATIVNDDDFEGRCNKVYSHIRHLRHLYACKNPSRSPLEKRLVD
jgi:hypothetical protein